MAISEIEKLERRYQENPQGLTFAPLAEAYRKSGDPERALARLLPGLELHPDYIPASIVQGRCHLDMGNDAGAEASFAHVLSLDAENVIALKALADIAERGARFPDATRWLEQLLAVDRSNEGAEAQLERVRSAADQAAAAGEGALVAGALDLGDDDVPAVEGLEIEAPASPEPEPVVDALPPLSTVERATEDARLGEEEPPPPVTPAFDPALLAYGNRDSDASVLDDAILGVTQLGGGEDIVLEAAPSTEYQLPSASEDFVKPSVEATGTASEFQLPSASEELDLTPSSAASEYQLPSASDDLALPDMTALGGASEFQLPDASGDLGTVPLTGTEHNEFQAPDAAHDLSGHDVAPAAPTPLAAAASGNSVSEVPTDPPPAPSMDAPEATSEPDEAPGQWRTWSDAALDPAAAPFPAAAPEPPAWVPPVEAALPPAIPDASAADAAGEPVAPLPIAELDAEVPDAEPAAVVTPEDPVVSDRVLGDTVVAGDDYDVEAELVVTESMAELFLAQGHSADALRVYRQLLDRRPGDERLVRLVAQLEVEAIAEEPTPRLAASMSGGTSVREMMRSLLTSRPNGAERVVAPASTSPDVPGSPTRPAPDHLTLSAIFGDDAAPMPPVMRAPPARPAVDPGVSFDEFYGTAAQPAAGGHERSTRLPDGDDDLDQFHDWLQNLKR